MLQSCGTVSETFGGSKRSKSGDEFLVHKKRPLVLPPDFKKMPSPKPMDETGKKLSKSEKMRLEQSILQQMNMVRGQIKEAKWKKDINAGSTQLRKLQRKLKKIR